MSGPVVLNLGCGYQTSARCINIDWSLPIRLKGSPVGRKIAPLVLTKDRKHHYDLMDGEIRRHDLRTGIPFEDGTVDAVYHSHVLEHIDREAVPGFLREVRRVLRPGGVHRIVVPDLELQARAYLASLEDRVQGRGEPEGHEETVHELIEQMVRREAHGTSLRGPVRRRVENLVLGDARRRGQTHQWMWDRASLPHELLTAGFVEPRVLDHRTSGVADWPGYLLDESAEGEEYRPGSMYVEAVAPPAP